MRRVPYRKPTVQISLFPFLAVLICTMGSLIVLLVLVVQQARVQADEVSRQEREQAAYPDKNPLEEATEDYQWEFDMLQHERSTIAQEADRRQAELAHLEGHIEDLEERWKRMQQEVANLEQLAGDQSTALQSARASRTLLEQQIANAKQRLDQARRDAEARPTTYSIIPYEGPNGTQRRPIYLECDAQGLTIQPEGVRISATDFAGLIGPGNPVDAALRTIRQYQSQMGLRGEAYRCW